MSLYYLKFVTAYRYYYVRRLVLNFSFLYNLDILGHVKFVEKTYVINIPHFILFTCEMPYANNN